MLDRFRFEMGLRAAKAAISSRIEPKASFDVHHRTVLVVLPDDELNAKAAWRLILDIDVPRTKLIPVAIGERVSYAPDAFAGGVRVITPKELDWKGLPRKTVLEEIWSKEPNVAIDFSHPFNLAASYLCGASPARFRIALHNEAAEEFNDILLSPQSDLGTAFDAMKSYLEAVEPPVISFK